MDPILQGLTISAMGLFITFLALGLLIGVIVLLQRLFPYKPEVEEEQPKAAEAEISLPEASQDDAIAAAIAVAVSYVQSQNQANLGANLGAGRGSWWFSSRIAARQGKVVRK